MAAALVRVVPTVRPVRSDDLEFIARLANHVFRKYDASAVRSVMRMVRHLETEAILAEAGDIPIGFAVVRLRRLAQPYGPWRKPVVANLDAIAVRPEFEGRGLGRFLLEQAEHIARANDAISMSLLTAVDNRSAKRLFHSAGYHLMTALDAVYIDEQRGLTMIKGLRSDSTDSSEP